MKKATLFLIVALGLAFGCNDEAEPPTLGYLPEAISMPVRAVGYPWYEDLQLTNVGEGVLVIESLTLQGDPGCGFRFQTDGSMELAAAESLLIRAWFEPSAPGDYTVALVVESSDADEAGARIEIPICGRAVAPGTTEEVAPIPIEECTAPAATDPVCAEDRIEETP